MDKSPIARMYEELLAVLLTAQRHAQARDVIQCDRALIYARWLAKAIRDRQLESAL